MDSDGDQDDFGFAFNDWNFSDRILRIEVVADFFETKTDDGFEWARKRKRGLEEETNKENDADVVMQREKQIQNSKVLNCSLPDTEEEPAYENQDEEAEAMLEESDVDITANHPGNDEASKGNNSSTNMDSPKVLRVRALHISSPILAAKSPFFYKLFSNGMRESEQRHVTMRIQASEEAAFMDLLNFMYSNTLSSATPTAVLDVLMAADKFEVASCMRYCSRLLRNMPMTCESALLYLELPSSISMADAVLPLTAAAKQFLAATFKDLVKFQKEVMDLPLSGMEAVLSSDDLQVASEDSVFDFVLKWARIHYPRLEERREILSSRLCRLIRFPHMTGRKLKKVLACIDFDPDIATNVVMEGLFFKAEAPYRQRSLAAEEANAPYRRFVERSYKYRPVKVVEFISPNHQCIVYMDLTRGECSNLFPAGRIYSQAFHLARQGFFLSAHCNMEQQSASYCFGLFVGMQEKESVSMSVNYEFQARTNPTKDFVTKYKGNYTFTGGKAVGYRNLFGVDWTEFMADNSIYFVDGILHLRAELTVMTE